QPEPVPAAPLAEAAHLLVHDVSPAPRSRDVDDFRAVAGGAAGGHRCPQHTRVVTDEAPQSLAGRPSPCPGRGDGADLNSERRIDEAHTASPARAIARSHTAAANDAAA